MRSGYYKYFTWSDILAPEAANNRRYRAMRVIAGKYRGRPLRSLRGTDIRPTSDRLRETLFNVLTAGNPQALEGSVWLDLFAGTGAVGIEAISRGAKQVYFVDTSAAAAKLIEQNLQSLGIVGGYQNPARRSFRSSLATAAPARRRRRSVPRPSVSHAARLSKRP